MRRAIGLLICTLLVSTAVWLLGGGEPVLRLSAQTDSSNASASGGYEAAARRFMDEARKLAANGDRKGAERLARTANSFPVQWRADEQTPSQFIESLNVSQASVAEPAPEPSPAAPSFAPPAGWSEQPAQTPQPTRAAPPAPAPTNNPFESADSSPFAAPDRAPEPPNPSLFESNDGFQTPQAPPEQPNELAGPVEIPTTSKGRAALLLRQARAALRAGRYEEARARALQAKQINASFGLFEDRPEHVLADIERETGTETLFAAPTPPPAEPAPAVDDVHETALKLIADARAMMAAGNLAEARAKAEQAAELETSFSAFEDRPDMVLADITNLESTASPDTDPSMESDDPHERAVALLRAARQDIDSGRLAAAREKAVEASKIDATYDLFEDRPELVLNDIDRELSGRSDFQTTTPAPGMPGAPSFGPEADGDDFGDSAKLNTARQLLSSAREDLRHGVFESALAKLQQAEALDATYADGDDTPDAVRRDLQAAAPDMVAEAESGMADDNPFEMPADGDVAAADENAMPTDDSEPNPFEPAEGDSEANPFEPEEGPFANQPVDMTAPGFGAAEPATASEFDVIHPEGESALDLYNKGLAELRTGNRAAAYQAFQQAWQSGQQLDAFRSQQLQDFLRDLAPSESVQLASGTSEDGDNVPTLEFGPQEPASELDLVAQQQAVKYDRLRTEVLNAVYRAESLRESNPEEALEILDRTTASVEGAELDENSVATLMGYLRRSQESIQLYQEQHAPIVEMQKQSRETLNIIEREQEYKLRVEQEFAEHVEEFNKLMRERRYAEAEVEARKAKALDPENPVAETMTWKAQFAREIARNEDIKDRKQRGVLDVLAAVDEASIPSAIDFAFPKDWKDLVERRKPYEQSDNRFRTEKEVEIEESLTRPISLDFDNRSLSEVFQHIATVTGVNVVLDKRAFEDQQVPTDEKVSINVDGIMLKSALNLLLEPYELAYTIENEVLKITNTMRQEGQLRTVTYPVADLVVPVPNFDPINVIPAAGGLTPAVNSQSANFSVPSGGLQNPGGSGALFQVNDPIEGFRSFDPTGGANGLSQNQSNVDFDAIIDLIISTIDPTSWDEVAGLGSVRSNESTLSLVIRQTQRVHEEIRELLAQLRRLQDLQVTVEVRFISVTDRFFERIGVDFDFNIQDTVGDPPGTPAFGSRQLTFPGDGGAAGGGGGGQQGQDLRGLTGVGGIGGGGGQQGGQGGQQGQQQQGGGGLFDPIQRVRPPLDNWPSSTVVGLASPDRFTDDFDVSFRQGSFEIGVPDFGNFNPDAGIQVGMAILSDIEAFFFIQAAQADERANLLFAPKVTLFNGQIATVTDSVQRPFVISLIPTVGNFSIGFQPVIQVIPDGIFLTVQAVISADRRFVRLSISPNFTNLIDVFTFSFIGGGGGLGGGQQGGGGQFGGGGGGFGGGGGGGLGFGGIGGFGGGFGGGQGGGGFGGGGGQQGQQGIGGLAGATVTVQQPVIETINVSTTVSVPDGGTVLLGGIKRLREGRNMAGVPILNKIPYLSRLFKNTGVGRETESVMLMVTPRIIIQEEEEELVIGGSATD